MDSNIIKKHNFKFNKKFGQNFIFDQNLLRAIVADADIAGHDVLEIGPGAGTLTREIARVARHVVAYEIDENLRPILQENLADANNVQVIFKDFMQADIGEVENNFRGKYSVVANLPYYITTPIIFKLVEQAHNVDKLVIMVQYEVAKRLTSECNNADYGAVTVALNAVADVSIARKVGRANFVPVPNVDSAIVVIEFNRNKYDFVDKGVFDRLVKSAFAMRRKTLANNLKSAFGLNSDQIEQLLTKCNLPVGIRGEALSVGQFVLLANTMAVDGIH